MSEENVVMNYDDCRISGGYKGDNSGMIGLFYTCCSNILSRGSFLVRKSPSCGYLYPSRVASYPISGGGKVNLGLFVTRFQSECYYSKKAATGSSRKRKVETKPLMKDKEEFFVVRKGDVVGVYKSLSDCQAQVGTLISDPPVSVFKGCNMPKDTEKYLISCGLKNALYTIRASDLTEGLFGALVQCPVQVSSSTSESSSEPPVTKKRSHEALWSDYGVRENHYPTSCTLEFDGASKGNPGQAGAGAILRSDNGSLILKLREGLGVTTCNVAEYRAFILGLKGAIGRGFTSVTVRGDSKLVCMQLQGQWRARNQNISTLFEEAKKLKDKFASFQIMHVLRHLNSEADAQANLAVELAEGQVQEEVDG
ncbi:RNase H family protein [Striga hermonthica]|uniref:RNase H family protein n=1 Tax=Striga hermonthica TaxID=68872 RepID=A0A9N7R8C4_STRHE|nr:RNase H family protein [Striga hermonthica]